MNESLKDARILIVDDNQVNIDVLYSLLEYKGYLNIQTTLDSRDVIGMIQTFQPEILLLDLMMPYFSGFDIMQLIKDKGLESGTMPILILTADASADSKKRALLEGASDFLTKPFDFVEVDLRIKNLLMNVYLLAQVKQYNVALEEKVFERTGKIIELNKELILTNDRIEKKMETIQLQNVKLKEIAWIQSHVVRAPLARLMGLAEALKRGTLTITENPEVLQYILQTADELDKVIADITSQTIIE